MKLTTDKLLHLLVGYTISTTTSAILTQHIGLGAACIFAVMLSVILGFIKEAWDYEHPANHSAETWDFLATALGGVAGTGMIYYVMSSLGEK